MTLKISYVVAFITGLGLLFLGSRFFFSPELAEAGYGIQFADQGDYSFHYIKGIRDVFSGLLICVLVLMKERRALGMTLLAGTMIPAADMFIVLSKPYNGLQPAISHICAVVICFVFGIILLTIKPAKKKI